jgi:RNA polymerase sigma-70 factor (ECF subfamily)
VTFRTTRWSLVIRSQRPDPDGTRAFAELCATYWAPVYALYRHSGLQAADAEDLTQGLFAELLERGDLGRARPERGRFRAYLCSCARHFLANQRGRARAAKRGGGRLPLSLDLAGEESRLGLEPADRRDPAACFDRRWAEAVIETAFTALERSEREAGRGAQFDLLRPVLEGETPPAAWAKLAAEHGSSEGALKVAAHRLKQRFQKQLRAAVRDTVDAAEDVGDELAELLRALG